jgi:hypothetical protein
MSSEKPKRRLVQNKGGTWQDLPGVFCLAKFAHVERETKTTFSAEQRRYMARFARPILPGVLCQAYFARRILPGVLCQANFARRILLGKFRKT